VSIINFTVNYDLFASQTDSSDSGIDADIVPLIGTVKFTPLTTDNRPVLAPTYSPRPAGFKLQAFTGYIDVDGRLKSERSGAIGVRLWANDPVLKLTSLNYKVEFDLRTPLGDKVKVDPGYFTAPSTDVSVQLAEVLQATGTVSTSTILPQGPKGDRGYSILGLTPALDGTYVQALVESASGPVAVGTPFLPSNSYNSTVTHGTNASYSRPAVSVAVIWIGSVQPNNAINGDVWLDTSGTTPSITTTVIDSLSLGVNTNQFLLASGTTPLDWTTTAGVLPSGLTLSSNGNLYGIPSASASYSFTVTASNAYGSNARAYTGTVGSAVAPTITTTALGGFPTAGVAYSQLLVATGSVPVTWSVNSGTLPTGLSLNTSTGVISGTPSASGSYSFTIRATNSAGYNDKAFTGSVSGSAPTISTTSLDAINQGTAFSQTPSFAGTASITWSVSSGTLPTGLSLNSSSGLISGTPSGSGSYSFTVTGTNSFGSASQLYTGTIASAVPVVTTASLSTMWRAFAFSQTVAATGASTITWSVSSGTLPAGLSLNTSTGTISGTPTTVGSYSFAIRATNSYGTGDKAFAVSVLQSTPAIVETSLNAIRISTAFSQTLTLTTGGPTITWSVQSGTLPAGLALNASTGTISGTPTVSGSYSLAIRATNGVEYNDKTFTGTIAGAGPSFISASSIMGTNTTFTAPAGSKVIVLVNYYAPPSGLSATPVLKLGGTTMTNKGYAAGSYAASYSSYVFAFEGTADGSAQLIEYPSVGQLNFAAAAFAFDNVTTVGTAQAANYGAMSPAVQNVTSATNHLILQAFYKASGGAWTGYSQTQRLSITGFVVGTAAGGSSVNFSASTGSLNGDVSTLCLAVDLT